MTASSDSRSHALQPGCPRQRGAAEPRDCPGHGSEAGRRRIHEVSARRAGWEVAPGTPRGGAVRLGSGTHSRLVSPPSTGGTTVPTVAAGEHRDIIGQAKGILMATVGGDARGSLRPTCRGFPADNRKLFEVATDVAGRNQAR